MYGSSRRLQVPPVHRHCTIDTVIGRMQIQHWACSLSLCQNTKAMKMGVLLGRVTRIYLAFGLGAVKFCQLWVQLYYRSLHPDRLATSEVRQSFKSTRDADMQCSRFLFATTAVLSKRPARCP